MGSGTMDPNGRLFAVNLPIGWIGSCKAYIPLHVGEDGYLHWIPTERFVLHVGGCRERWDM